MTEVERLATVFETFAKDHKPDGWPAVQQHFLSEASALLRSQAAEIEALRKDAARFNYVASCTRCYGADIDGMHSYSTQYRHTEVRGPSFVEAIDAAITKESSNVGRRR